MLLKDTFVLVKTFILNSSSKRNLSFLRKDDFLSGAHIVNCQDISSHAYEFFVYKNIRENKLIEISSMQSDLESGLKSNEAYTNVAAVMDLVKSRVKKK